MALISPSRRLRRTPFSDGVEAAGVKAYTVYNHMLLPTVFESVEADYHHLKRHVQVWDVACERSNEVDMSITRRQSAAIKPHQTNKSPLAATTRGRYRAAGVDRH